MDWSKYSKINLNNELNKVDFESFKNLTLNEKSEYLSEKMPSAMNLLVGKKTIKLMEDNKWFDCSLYILQHERNIAYNIALYCNNTEVDKKWGEYRKIRNRYVRECNAKMNKEIEEMVENFQKDSNKLWKVLK
jgi:uncharacterized protein YlbG (UPF0298 family)